MNTELKPCPFCGSVNVEISPYDGKNVVICMNCFCKNSGNVDLKKSKETWNRRIDGASKKVR